jgi:glycosyltransferase involved in cell wall biosynthesis
MHILHISPTYKPAYTYGGVTVSISLLCETLADAGHDVTVLSTTANGKEEDLPAYTHQPNNVEGAKAYYFPYLTKGTKQFSPRMLWWLWQNVKRFEVVHLHSWWNFDALFSMAICRIRGVKSVFSPRGMLSTYSTSSVYRRFFNKYIGTGLFKNSHLHATATQELDECLNLKPDWPYTVLPNLMKTDVLNDVRNTMYEQNTALSNYNNVYHGGHPEIGHRSSDIVHPFNLLFFSRIHPKKGIENLFDALKNVPFDWTLTIAGDGDADYIQALKTKADKLHISLNINWIGWVNPKEKYAILQDADMMVLPSYSENFANVVVEALAVGTPVMVSNKTGLSDYVLEKNMGWVCATTVESIRQTLMDAFTDFDKRNDISDRAPACIAADFTPSVLVEKYVKMYQSL